METSHEYLRTIHNEAVGLTGLINDFLDLQRIESGGFHPLDRAARARRAPPSCGRAVQRQSDLHTIQLELDGGPLSVAADEDRVVQLVGNLLLERD